MLSIGVSSIGSTVFSISDGIATAFFARVIVASGDALVFTSLLKLVALRFPGRRFGLFSGLSQVSGYIGGALATTPLAVALTHIGWRGSFGLIAAVSALNLLCGWFVLPEIAKLQKKNITLRSVIFSAVRALKKSANWGCAMTFASHFAIVTTLAGIWGLPMIEDYFGVDASSAGIPLLGFMIGNAVGSVLLGHAADIFRRPDRTLIVLCVFRAVLIVFLTPALAHGLGFAFITCDFATIGILAGGTVPLVLKCTKRLYTSEFIGVGASINTTTAGIVAAIAQPVIGIAMTASNEAAIDPTFSHALVNDAGYRSLIEILVALSIPGVLGPMVMAKSMMTDLRSVKEEINDTSILKPS
ncbi:hypothetical protein GCM10023157_25150 [Gluconacetobacter asukensis]